MDRGGNLQCPQLCFGNLSEGGAGQFGVADFQKQPGGGVGVAVVVVFSDGTGQGKGGDGGAVGGNGGDGVDGGGGGQILQQYMVEHLHS